MRVEMSIWKRLLPACTFVDSFVLMESNVSVCQLIR